MTESTRVTRKEAARMAGVSERTINRWSAAGLITPEHGPSGSRIPVTYDPVEVIRVATDRNRTP